MYGFRMYGAGHLVPVQVPDPCTNPGPGKVIVRLAAAAICGSDIPKYHSTVDLRSGLVGYPIHECVGRVVASACADLVPGSRVLAMPLDNCGLVEMYLAEHTAIHRIRNESLTDVQATLIQPLATVLHAVSALDNIAGARVAVIGLGPIGLLCAHVLRQRGAATIIGVDPVDRHDVSARFGLASQLNDISAAWATSIHSREFIDVCVEAVGHQQSTLRDAIKITRRGGTVLALGVPDDSEYVVPYQEFFRKNLTLKASVSPYWPTALAAAEDYLTANLAALSLLITHTFDIADTNTAFRTYAVPSPGRMKVALTAGTWAPNHSRAEGYHRGHFRGDGA
jgi:threonine dehydrogenase-like Zn-dependent dehydrogenase